MKDEVKAHFEKHEIETLQSAIDAYCDVHPAGGSLHIVLDDGNWRRSDIEHCAEWARENGDLFGEAIAKTLLKIPDDILALGQTDECDRLGRILRAWRERRAIKDRRARGVTHLVTVWTGSPGGFAAGTVYKARIAGEGAPARVCEHMSEADAREDFAHRVQASKENAGKWTYKIEASALEGSEPLLSHVS